MNVARSWLIRFLKALGILITAIVVLFGIVALITQPSNDREWNDDQTILPRVEINGDTVSIFNIRSFEYASTTSYTARYYDKTFDLKKLQRVWYIVEPFEGIPGSAHTFLSFEFEGEHFVAISVEIRKEKGESYHPFKGLFNRYELMYVIADENDVIKLRSNHRKDLVYVYPIKTTTEKAQLLFLDMVQRANDVSANPEFYNTLTNTCTTNIVQHIQKISPRIMPFFDVRILLPANSDKLAYDLGLIDTDLTFEQARLKFNINERAMLYADDPEFSKRIRGW